MGITNRAFTLLDVKSVSEDERVIEGIASTPRADRLGDVVVSEGATFALPMPLLLDHKHDKQVGHVEYAKPTKDGIPFRARIAKIAEPGEAKSLVDHAWQLVRHRLRAAVSIGFRPLEDGVELLKTGGLQFNRWEWLELSLVSVPAQSDAVIFQAKGLNDAALAALKQHDTSAPAATGTAARPVKANPPGASGPPATPVPKKGARIMAKTIAEQLSAFENTRASKAVRLKSIMDDAAERGETLDAEQEQEHDDLEAEVAKIDKHLERLRRQEQAEARTAKPVDIAKSFHSGSEARVPATVRHEAKIEPGIRFARLAKCVAMAKGSLGDAQRIAEAKYGDDHHLNAVMKAAVGAGSTIAGNWAADLVSAEGAVFADFAEFLRPATIIGRFGTGGIPSLRRVPFRVPLGVMTGGGAGYWVGQGLPKPLTSFDFDRSTIEPTKVANICVLTEELIRDASAPAEAMIRDALRDALVARLDTDFIDPAKVVAAGISPASITNGAATIAANGTDADAIRSDVRGLFQKFIDANNPPSAGVWIMSTKNALSLSLLLNPLGQPEFPGLSMTGGSFVGMPVIVSDYAGTSVVLVNASDIFLADEGGVAVDMSREASLQMDSAPPTQSALTGTGIAQVSLWQTNSVGLRAERTIGWKRRRASAVAYITGALWGGAVPAS
jgi:HK97 family phage major capsid protein